MNSFVHVIKRIDYHFVGDNPFVENPEFIKLLFSVKILHVEIIFCSLNEFVVFLNEAVPVSKVSDSETKPQNL